MMFRGMLCIFLPYTLVRLIIIKKDERPINTSAVMPAAPLIRCPACYADAVIIKRAHPSRPRRLGWLKALFTYCYSSRQHHDDESAAYSNKHHDGMRTGECQACEFAFHFPATGMDERVSMSSLSRRGSDILESDKRQHAIHPLRPPSAAWVVRTGWTPQPDFLELMQRVWCGECGVFVDKRDATPNGCCGQCGSSLRA